MKRRTSKESISLLFGDGQLPVIARSKKDTLTFKYKLKLVKQSCNLVLKLYLYFKLFCSAQLKSFILLKIF